jgi:hypothetical protein
MIDKFQRERSHLAFVSRLSVEKVVELFSGRGNHTKMPLTIASAPEKIGQARAGTSSPRASRFVRL